ncbi:uncharacterized protein K452DRAFT_76656 [Aplosporella prunicola CBS 121167]|uniref:Uncharacterized protein n=1 Tax=Aplosporella prunicola CBS 121167 TaxID=1176127 RepID=A0A6A6B7N8_9PEZI|nr:uncharacterized protein K452DRAFT_76656 [Aplosporella prunicola CBS 121167]KAF2139393.1 hypothetical protein K452DRAFT_76656 [Aplosporella prunicola CBS 121167]
MPRPVKRGRVGGSRGLAMVRGMERGSRVVLLPAISLGCGNGKWTSSDAAHKLHDCAGRPGAMLALIIAAAARSPRSQGQLHTWHPHVSPPVLDWAALPANPSAQGSMGVEAVTLSRVQTCCLQRSSALCIRRHASSRALRS